MTPYEGAANRALVLLEQTLRETERERDELRAEVARLTAHRLSRDGMDVSVLVGYEAGQAEVETLRKALRNAVNVMTDALARIRYSPSGIIGRDEILRWRDALAAALEGQP